MINPNFAWTREKSGIKAIVLISGGLDSILAARLIREQGIEVVPISFKIPFCHRDKEISGKNNFLLQLVSDNLGIELRIIDIEEAFLKLLVDPAHGFGANMNPCIDCKILMLGCAKKIMEDNGAQFVATGEVLGQRPMSQHKNALRAIGNEAGLGGLLLRPLSARLLPETIPEIQGWINRAALLGLAGRSRRPQLELANKFGIRNFAWPAGGCLLTDKEFCRRLKDLIAHNELNRNNVALLKLGRHFRISDHAKLVVGRDEKENLELQNLAGAADYLFYPHESLAGPTALGRGGFNPGLIRLAAEITCRYCDLNGKSAEKIICRQISHEEQPISVSPARAKALEALRI